MEVNKIQEELARLTQLVEGWAGSRDISGIERDLALDKLKKLYEAVRFADFNGEPVAASVSAPKPVEEPIAKEMPEPEISIDLDDLLAEPIRNSEPEPEVAPIPEVKAEPVADSPDTPAEAPSPVANEEPVAEESAAASVAPVTIDTPAEPEPKIASDATPEKGLAESSAVADSGQKEDGAVSNSLFDLDDLVIRHREKRRVIMSLYETDGPQEAAPKGGSEPKRRGRDQAPLRSAQPKAKGEKEE